MSGRKRRRPRNTEEDLRSNPFMAGIELFEAERSGLEAFADRHESDGQRSFVQSDTLPTEMKSSDREVLENAGVMFGTKVEGDDLFQYVDLPTGWSKEPTSHSMWSYLVDDKGRRRASIFYNGSFWDRAAHLSTCRRFNCEIDYDQLNSNGLCVANVTNGPHTIHTTKTIVLGERMKYDVTEEARKLAETWLDAHYPNWRDEGMYWD